MELRGGGCLGRVVLTGAMDIDRRRCADGDAIEGDGESIGICT